MTPLSQFAEAESQGIFDALGIDFKMLIFQIIGFVVLVLLLRNFVFPPLFRSVDKRHEEIQASLKAAEAAEKKADAAREEITDMLHTARTEATDIVTTAREEAAATLADAAEKAKSHADSIVKAAHAEIEKDVAQARKALHNETIDLVALATEKVTSKTISKAADKSLIESAISEAK